MRIFAKYAITVRLVHVFFTAKTAGESIIHDEILYSNCVFYISTATLYSKTICSILHKLPYIY